MQPLAAWLEQQDPEWVQSRSDELGPPDIRPAQAANRRALLLSHWKGVANRERHRAREEFEEFEQSDPDRAMRADRSAKWRDIEIAEYDSGLRERSKQLDDWANQDRVMRAVAYSDAAEFHRRRGIELQVELSLQDLEQEQAPPHIEALIGRQPHEHDVRGRWEKIFRELERDRIGALADQEQGVTPTAKDPAAQARLDQAVDQLRTERGMPPREQPAREAVLDGAEIGMA